MKEEEVSFLNNRNESLAGIVRIPLTQEEDISTAASDVDAYSAESQGTEKRFPIAIICHDFMQNKDFGFIRDLFNIISYAGFLTLRFDFSGNGLSEGRFDIQTISKQRQDLTAALDFMFRFKQANPKKCLIIGHGTGADVALLEAAEDKRITALALIEGYFNLENHINSYFGGFVNELKAKGEVCLENRKYIKKDYLTDIKRHDIKKAAEKIKIPVFIAHATMDYRVPIHDARMLYLKLKEPKTFEIIDDADHDYTSINRRNFLIELLTNWINKTFKSI